MYKRWLPFVLTVVMLFQLTADVSATTISDVSSQKKQTENSLSSVNNQIEQITSRQEELKEEIEQMDTVLVDVLTSISICKDEIVAKEEQVVKAKTELEQAKAEEQSQYEAMRQRIRFMYEQGDNAYLKIFLESKSISDMLNKADYVEKLYSYDRELLDTYTQKKEDTKEKKENLEEEEAELLSANYELEQEQESLERMIEEKRATVSNFDAQLASAKAQAEQYKKELTRQTQQLRRLEEEKRQQEAQAKKEAEAKKQQEAAKANTDSTPETSEANSGASADGQTDDADKQDNGGQTDDADKQDGDGQNTDGAAADAEGTTEDASENTDDAAQGSDSGSQDSSSDAGKKDTGGSSLGQQIASYATQFVGNPYKFGGTSLTSGTDCSGFTMSVYAHFGISIPRDSTSQRSAGRAVSYADAQPGDIICYAGHVAIYIGNGQIVHASTEATGIKYGTATYRTILAVRRIV